MDNKFQFNIGDKVFFINTFKALSGEITQRVYSEFLKDDGDTDIRVQYRVKNIVNHFSDMEVGQELVINESDIRDSVETIFEECVKLNNEVMESIKEYIQNPPKNEEPQQIATE